MQLNARTTRSFFSSSAVATPAPLRCHSSACGAVAPLVRVARVDDDLARELGREIGADLRHRAVGHGDEHDRAECRGLARRADVRARPELLGERLELLGMTRRHEDLVARVDPMAREGAADPARADDADLQRLLRRRDACVDERGGA